MNLVFSSTNYRINTLLFVTYLTDFENRGSVVVAAIAVCATFVTFLRVFLAFRRRNWSNEILPGDETIRRVIARNVAQYYPSRFR